MIRLLVYYAGIVPDQSYGARPEGSSTTWLNPGESIPLSELLCRLFTVYIYISLLEVLSCCKLHSFGRSLGLVSIFHVNMQMTASRGHLGF